MVPFATEMPAALSPVRLVPEAVKVPVATRMAGGAVPERPFSFDLAARQRQVGEPVSSRMPSFAVGGDDEVGRALIGALPLVQPLREVMSVPPEIVDVPELLASSAMPVRRWRSTRWRLAAQLPSRSRPWSRRRCRRAERESSVRPRRPRTRRALPRCWRRCPYDGQTLQRGAGFHITAVAALAALVPKRIL